MYSLFTSTLTFFFGIFSTQVDGYGNSFSAASIVTLIINLLYIIVAIVFGISQFGGSARANCLIILGRKVVLDKEQIKNEKKIKLKDRSNAEQIFFLEERIERMKVKLIKSQEKTKQYRLKVETMEERNLGRTGGLLSVEPGKESKEGQAFYAPTMKLKKKEPKKQELEKQGFQEGSVSIVNLSTSEVEHCL